ncbi:hypothetical protein [Paenibacillus sp. OAS669]|uniref:hypothetical protein n=1 Tax=Paenibacillus sp. OAS669 TaxID=2663821 RepID=UPI00178BC66F|nr:hypothetical protein [Paenibacillus sp. OAS669]MBE1441517.1 hypothetical protein [Paenibacillus sp. OAS669]
MRRLRGERVSQSLDLLKQIKTLTRFHLWGNGLVLGVTLAYWERDCPGRLCKQSFALDTLYVGSEKRVFIRWAVSIRREAAAAASLLIEMRMLIAPKADDK